MNYKHYLTVGLGTLLTFAPQLMTFIPPVYRDSATALFGFLTSLYHLTTPTPEATQKFGEAAK